MATVVSLTPTVLDALFQRRRGPTAWQPRLCKQAVDCFGVFFKGLSMQG